MTERIFIIGNIYINRLLVNHYNKFQTSHLDKLYFVTIFSNLYYPKKSIHFYSMSVNRSQFYSIVFNVFSTEDYY